MIILLAKRSASSFSKDALRGEDKLMRSIYIDEAGTSVGEPVSIVVGVIVHGDTQWKTMDRHLCQVKEKHIPVEHRTNFVIHCKDILAGKKAPFFNDKENWPANRRMKIIYDVLSGSIYLTKLPL